MKNLIYILIISMFLLACGSPPITQNENKTPNPPTISEPRATSPRAPIQDISWSIKDTYKWVKGHAQSSYDGKLIVASGLSLHFGAGLIGESQDIRVWDNVGFYVITALPKNKGYLKGVTEGSILHLIAGREPPDFSASYEHYTVDLSNGMKEYRGDVNDPRISYCTGIFSDGKIIIAGGYKATWTYRQIDENTIIDTVEIYDPITNTWTFTTKLPYGPRTHCDGVVYNDKFYKFGGFWQEVSGGEGHHQRIYDETVLIYDPSNGSWSEGARMPIPLSGLSVTLVNDEIVLTGGHHKIYGFNQRVFTYDPIADTFLELPTLLPSPANDSQLTLIDGKLYLFGGEIPADSTVKNTSDLLQIGTLKN